MDLDQLTRHLSPRQIRSIVGALDTPQIALWAGAVSSGKTIASLLALLIAVTRAPHHGIVVICGRTLQTIERNLLDPLQTPELYGPLAHQVRHTPGATTATILGRTVHLVGASDVRAESRIRGATVALAYVDEATLVPEGFWMMLLSRLRVEGAKLLATTNPDGPGHWLRQSFLLRADTVGLRHWHFTLEDNPQLPRSYVERLRSQYTGVWYRRFVEGEWIAGEGAIYDMWDPDVHVVAWETLPRMRRLLAAGVDYGTTNPTAALLLGLGVDGRLYLVDEWRHDPHQATERLTDAALSARLRAWLDGDHLPGQTLRPEHTVVDPSAASLRLQLYQDGLATTPAHNHVGHGISMVASLLSSRRLLVSDRCTGWLSEVGGYSWDPAATAKGEDAPVKTHDHSLDAARYAIATTEAVWRPMLPTTREEA